MAPLNEQQICVGCFHYKTRNNVHYFMDAPGGFVSTLESCSPVMPHTLKCVDVIIIP